MEVYWSIGEPDSLYSCGGEMMTSPLTRCSIWGCMSLPAAGLLRVRINALNILTLHRRIRTYEHEALWGKALTSYDLHASLPEVTRHVGIVEVKRVRASCLCFGLSFSAVALSVAPTGPAELWPEQHPCHLHEGSGE